MQPELIDAIMTLAILGLLVYYRMKKRFKQDRKTNIGLVTGILVFLDHNIVEIIFIGVLIPGLPGIVAQSLAKWL